MSRAIFAQFYSDFLKIAKDSVENPVDATIAFIVILKANPSLTYELEALYKQCQHEVGII